MQRADHYRAAGLWLAMFYRLLSWLPLPLLYLLAWPGYLLLYYVGGYRKAVVRQNLSHAFPDKARDNSQFWQRNFTCSWYRWHWRYSRPGA